MLQLPVWFLRYQVKTLEEPNRVLLKEYIKYYNTVQVHREIKMTPYGKFLALEEGSRFTWVEKEVDLDKIFSYQEERKVDRDNTIKFEGEVYPPQADWLRLNISFSLKVHLRRIREKAFCLFLCWQEGGDKISS
ncbi:MAG: hypothetical protein ABIK84_02940 [candidate division WOR-3 bacterium]